MNITPMKVSVLAYLTKIIVNIQEKEPLLFTKSIPAKIKKIN